MYVRAHLKNGCSQLHQISLAHAQTIRIDSEGVGLVKGFLFLAQFRVHRGRLRSSWSLTSGNVGLPNMLQ
jgi:hypothetical protein